MPMAFPGRRADDRAVLELLEESGRNVQRATLVLHDLVKDYPERADLARDMLLCEQEGDRITHDVIHALHGGGRRRRGGLQTADGHALASALDDIVDFAEQTSDTMSIYHIEAPMEQATALADVLVGAGEQVARALRGLRTGADMAPHLVEIHRLENEGDRVMRDAVASLFVNGIDPMVVIRWKDIFNSLEASVDACETVAHVLEGISLKRH
ncbi:MAG: hypothetical protein JWO02_4037 [Solirubrobacterales bacterium]|nr:hypothetical protein [Solirubrobacterales bacterium]